MRRESERAVLTLAYKVRAKANGDGAAGRDFVGMNTSRKIAKDGMRETIRQLKLRKERPQTAGGSIGWSRGGSRGGDLGENRTTARRSNNTNSPPSTGRRPSSAVAGFGGDSNRSRNQYDTMRAAATMTRTSERPKTAGVLTRDEEVKDLVKEYNMDRMMSTLTVKSESVGALGIGVKAVRIVDRSTPVEEQIQVGNFETTHLHKLRMGYLTGQGFAFDLDMTTGGGKKKSKKKNRGKKARPYTATGSTRPPRPRWKNTGEGPAWRPMHTESEPVHIRYVSTGSKYPNNPYAMTTY
jgi:hypothetical protein